MKLKSLVEVCSDSEPELYAALCHIPLRKRASRIRQLAGLGLMSHQVGWPQRETTHPVDEPEIAQADLKSFKF